MKKIIKNLDKPLLIVTLILFVIGLIMIFSASNITAFMKYGASPYRYFVKQLFFLIIGFILSSIIIKFNTKTYGAISWIGILVIICSLIFLLAYGEIKNQAISWFNIFGFGIQPSEFAKLIMIIWMASYYDLNIKKLDSYGKSLFPLLIAGVITLLIIFQPDLGTAIIFFGIVFFIFISVPVSKEIKRKIFISSIGLVTVVVFALISNGKQIIHTRQLERFDFTRPCDRFLTTGNQVCNGYIAINNGGLTGVSLGNSTQKYLYLPEPHTDFIFAILMEELGLVVAIGIILLMMFVLYRIIKIARSSITNRGAIMCYGVALLIFFHIIVNLMGLFGMMPLTGVPLPFMSYGGSFTITLIIALTIVQRVNVETKLTLEKMKK